MRNCPGAGRPTWMESFNRSSSAAQLSTKLVTGILKYRTMMAIKIATSCSGIPQVFLFTSQFSCQIMLINTEVFVGLVFFPAYYQGATSGKGARRKNNIIKTGVEPTNYSTINISFLYAARRFPAGFLGMGRKMIQNQETHKIPFHFFCNTFNSK